VFKGKELSTKLALAFNASLLLIATIIGATFPQVGSILGYVGGFVGLGLIYIIPIAVYLKRYKLKLEDPQLVEALDNNKIKTVHKMKRGNNPSSPKLVIDETTPPMVRRTDLNNSQNTSDISLQESLLTTGIYKPAKGAYRKFYLI